ncbi:MAG: hypothetical protein K2X47_17210, partial [Bdellovibrionales bacterium]|nr:hypothetical protein [Bdellovibrionales bacterium]
MRSMPSLLKTSLTLLIAATTVGSTAVLVSCASKPKHSFSPEAVPENEEKNVSAELEALRSQQIDVFSPKHFRHAEKS